MPPNDNRLVPGIVLKSIAGGMILMALLTCAWIHLAIQGLNSYGLLWSCISIGFGILLLIIASYYFLKAKHLPHLDSDADRQEGKKIGMWYGIIVGAEGLLIGGACPALVLTGLAAFILPVVALIVGVHFIPMAKIFRRTVDYYIATWTCIVGLTGVYMVSHGYPGASVNTMTGFGVGASTAAYGIYMIFAGYKIVKAYKAVDSPFIF
jgi:hypothetical protein